MAGAHAKTKEAQEKQHRAPEERKTKYFILQRSYATKKPPTSDSWRYEATVSCSQGQVYPKQEKGDGHVVQS